MIFKGICFNFHYGLANGYGRPSNLLFLSFDAQLTSSAVPFLMDICLPQGQDSGCLSLRPSPGDPSSRPLTGVGSASKVPFAAGRKEPLPPRKRKRRKQKKPNAQSCPICSIIPISLRHHVQWQHLPNWFQLEASCIDGAIVFETIIERADHQVTEQHPARDEEALFVCWMLGISWHYFQKFLGDTWSCTNA